MTALAESQLQEFEVSGPRPTAMTIEEMEKTRRLKYIVFSQDFFLGMLRQGRGGLYFKVEEPGIPADAMVVGFSEHARFATNQLVVKLWSSSFPVVEEAETMPELEVMLRRVEVRKP